MFAGPLGTFCGRLFGSAYMFNCCPTMQCTDNTCASQFFVCPVGKGVMGEASACIVNLVFHTDLDVADAPWQTLLKVRRLWPAP